MAEQNYIARMRAKVGHEGMIFNTVFWCIVVSRSARYLIRKAV